MGIYDDLELDSVEAVNTDFEPLPAGEYELVVEGFEDSATKAGTGRYYKVTFVIAEDAEKYAGRKVFHYFNYANKNATCQKIGRAQLKEFMNATKTREVDDLGDFIGTSCLADIKVRAAKGEYAAGNEIVNFKPRQAQQAPPKAGDTNFEELWGGPI